MRYGRNLSCRQKLCCEQIMEKIKRTRCNNFTANEIEVLLTLVESHKGVVECKKTDAVTNGEKEKEWEKIAIKFNSAVGTGRTSKHLRNKWDAWKKSTKKRYSDKKISLYKTGGGPYTDIKLGNWEDKVLGIMGVSATGTENKYDSDKFSDTINSGEADLHLDWFFVIAAEINADSIDFSNAVLDIADVSEINADKENLVSLAQVRNISVLLKASDWKHWNPAHLKKKPLDLTVFGPLKRYYNVALTDWLSMNPAKTCTIYEIANLSAIAIHKSFTQNNIQHGFGKSGIWPLNSEIFTDEDFLSSYVTDRPYENVIVAVYNKNVPTTSKSSSVVSSNVDQEQATTSAAAHQVSTSTSTDSEDKNTPSKSLAVMSNSDQKLSATQPVQQVDKPTDNLNMNGVLTSANQPFLTPETVRPYPKAQPRTNVSTKKKES
ncbi:hypothetical protein NQ317_019592 [Molorchus minor]|uniref:Regulatory protein zeste n=1 Tax=Molorchus minor TaxID=1323400 RepID=A0ABQ9IQF5_9CUCU|nr:hypothetical protein NQ317_019592 [Molorchus minor]